jgi:hypothetical protein
MREGMETQGEGRSQIVEGRKEGRREGAPGSVTASEKRRRRIEGS